MKKTALPDKANFPVVTVVMPVYNEARFIEGTLRQLLTQEYPADRLEIIVVDGMSQDATREIVQRMAREHSQIKLLENPKKRSSAGRNIGFKAGSGEYFVVIDGHCFLPNNQLIRNIADCFEKSGADCLGRPQPLDPPGLTDFQKAVALARASRIGHGGDSFIYSDYEGFVSPTSNGAAYRRNVFEKVGYVDETFDACEDVEFNYRVEKAGLTCYTAPSLAVQYYPRESLSALFRQLCRYGQGRRRFVRKHPEALTFNQLVPLFFVLGLAAIIMVFVGVFITDTANVLAGVFIFPYLLYAGLILYFSADISVRNGWQYKFILPLIFFGIHFSLGWGFLKEIFIFRDFE
ncbi:MAG: glycosyltransferase [Desulfobulbaceae bacterium DB1]|nr:MAG: glycosyltransferase [Desulfobulbaceae bacterium DB1]